MAPEEYPKLPKEESAPLVKIDGKAMIDYALDSLAEAGVEKVVVNVHHLADQMLAHLNSYKADEQGQDQSLSEKCQQKCRFYELKKEKNIRHAAE